MLPKLKSDVLYVPTPDGAHVFGAGADVALRGPAAYRLLDRLAPHLDGSTELDALVRGLPDGTRTAVERLVGRLQSAGCLIDAAADLPHGLTARELDTYAAEIAFVEYHATSAARRFQTYRDSAVTVVGAGPVFTALVCSALRSGVRRLRAVHTPDTGTDPAADADRLTELAAEAALRDPDQTLERVPFSAAEEDRLATADAVLHVAAGPAVERAPRLDRLCGTSGTLLVQGVVLDDVAWLGPPGPDWASAWSRLRARPPYRTGTFLTGPAAAVVAGHLGLAAFRALAGIEEPGARAALTRIDLETLRTSTHAFLPHPAARPAGPEPAAAFTARIGRLRAAAPLSAEEFSAAAAACFDPYTGVLRTLDEGDFTQIPLHVTEAVPHLADSGGPRVFGTGPDFAEARRRAALRGIARHAAASPDPRRFGPGATVWGWDLADGQPVRVPADTAFSAGTGLAARLSWDEAVDDGLGQHCARLAAEDVAAGRTRPVPLDLTQAPADERTARYLGLLRAAGGTARVADIGGALGVPVLAWWLDGRPVAVTCGPDAAAEGLERTLLARQSAMTDEPAYAPEPVPGLGDPPEPAPTAAWPAAPDRAALPAALRSRGLRPVAVPLDHDPAVHDVLPSVLRVVTADA
ncbi:YcaO-like family protein [Streptomyces mobaraensis NBRC 13819 = DSM 40847]|uniref:Uncharacterized protein n=1 Tax=Streptomyces mobaraensis (strain ATCC 29032 / DSM 40847 / JCM 4168 / NBRC 13819 / NCIMB 11159 / IPCR 16-22) TaxID=1223523 RepID=M3B341_STRM1|nr:YcaO-like family protein [Streptomyces mobaraensis]EMF00378.1 hypothetical protein H340_11735 [Streptomyces mobaraensis NBRC 13819 = DSM 40847]QTT77365.1 YcaO-like family protein [Streptomyces mobaraensis NBRC 13819 = DSM 40847]